MQRQKAHADIDVATIICNDNHSSYVCWSRDSQRWRYQKQPSLRKLLLVHVKLRLRSHLEVQIQKVCFNFPLNASNAIVKFVNIGKPRNGAFQS